MGEDKWIEPSGAGAERYESVFPLGGFEVGDALRVCIYGKMAPRELRQDAPC
jgi:hypothetical protein